MENQTSQSIPTSLKTASGLISPNFSEVSEKLQKHLSVLMAEVKWRQENELCQFYTPNGAVEKFIGMVGSKNNLVFTLSAANGIGKTTALVNLACNIIWGPQNRFFDYPLFKAWPFEKRMRFVSEPSQVKESGPLPTEIKRWWPRGRYQATKDGQHYASLYIAGDWILEVMTYEQATEQHEGANLGLVMFNEPPPQNLWTPNISRLRNGGMAIVAMTPLTDAGWFFDSVVPRHLETVVYADIEAACKVHGVRGHLDHDQIEKMISEYDPDEREARANGKAMYLKGLIFKNFDYNVHVSQKPIDVPEGAQVWQVVDPAVDKPFASIWGYPEKDGTFYQIAEWPNEDFYRMHGCEYGIEDYKKIFKNIELGWNVTKRIIDRHFADVRSLQTKRTLREDFEAIGLYYEPSYSASEEVETGILKVRSALKYNTAKPIDTVNRPKYIVDSRCKNTIKGFTRWSFDPKTGKVQDSYKDFMDCVRYALCANPKVSEAPPAPVYRKLYG